MRRSTLDALFSLLAAGLVCGPAVAEQIYKWVDDAGRVNYGTKPPDGVRAGQVQKVAPKISTVPFDKPEQAEVRAAEQRDQRTREQLDRDADRRASATSRNSLEEATIYWRERCYAEHRVDCDEPTFGFIYDPVFAYAPAYGAYYGPGGYYPPAIRPRPRPPIALVPNSAPPGYTIGPGPYGVGAGYVPRPERTPPTPVRVPARPEPR